MLLGVHDNREHSNQPVNQGGRRICSMSFSFLELYYCISVLPYSYYNPYNAPALINASKRFFRNTLYKLHELLHWMM